MSDGSSAAPQPQLLAFRTQFIVAGPGLVPWAYDEQFVAGMADYLGPDSGVSNLTVRNWAQVNLANFPVGPPRLLWLHALPFLLHALLQRCH